MKDMTTHQHGKVMIIGSGPAGYTAAVYAARAALQPLLIQGLMPGGQLTITTEVENWPGDLRVNGPDLMGRLEAHARHLGTTVITDHIVNVDLSARPFRMAGDGGATYSADALVIATGASARWLGLESETRYMSGGVSACATCDGFLYRNRQVAVVGGGNTAVEEALYLSNIADKVYLIHRRASLRADRTNQARLFGNPNIEVIWNTEVAEVLGDGQVVTAVAIRNTIDGAPSKLEIDGLFIAIGHDPATSLFKGQLDLDDDGYITVEAGTTKTSLPGVFAAGDVQDKRFRQAITSAALGCMAALEAERFLATRQVPCKATPIERVPAVV